MKRNTSISFAFCSLIRNFAGQMNTIEDYIKERERLEEEDGSCFMAEEPSWRNMAVNYNARLLASDIKAYFEINDDAVEVLIFRGNKMVSIKRSFASSPTFNRTFRKIYEK